jgi:sugar/nucleoside kinase (ribokinase family)
MLRHPPAPQPAPEEARCPIDLLVVGGLTIDRFPDGHQQPGGSVVHATTAMRLDGRRVAVVTLAGPEPAAVDGLHSLSAMAELHVQRTGRTIRYDHDESGDRRTLRLAASAGTLHHPVVVQAPRAVLYASIADELDASLGGQRYQTATAGAILQGWLRDLPVGEPVRSRRLADLDPHLAAALAGMDLLVASVEDLAAEPGDPVAQIEVLRRRFGQGPVVVVTGGTQGAWISSQDRSVEHVPVARVVNVATTVGAGDAFAARLLVGMAHGSSPAEAAADAAELVAAFLVDRATADRSATS